VRGDEQQERGVLHYHALLGRVEGVGLFGAVRLWEGFAGGWAKIEHYDNAFGGTFYLAKDGEVELSPAWFDQ